MINEYSEYQRLALLLKTLIQDEIRRQNLISTGKMLNSIQVNVIKTSTGYMLQFIAIDYFSNVNNKYNIMSNVKKSTGYANILRRIKEITIQSIQQELIIKK